ncbi:bifunctional hydroxymethylpyrimidine kinase/phosphomethylpyrimidine kinase [Azospirillum sp. CT11-132]|uniref:bifunctional hydroxymethylpyrimidine kinase/phosphomethylpyrimidine kinase n=1 Tax=unclassified Azospirillum TaxID=2630922 RepID=UPI000D60C731|nr:MULTISPECIES: bifunctional hydroxymethylpyrimidine kinase/phosphomethylpyrimidine kinase [unclassified Azospirillum]PWC67838.1 phosphomethylpyrimidine kinase [Azospirillum sp. TSH7]PWC71157.1 phosphomethylpyrimidine kinase [Azospirillum sp. TSH20]QCG93881.1 bifunctional hydroxymethylpyrimidine kinase/phosphomethylpyrimidine kinase [Azospirillum sp. TSA2s]
MSASNTVNGRVLIVAGSDSGGGAGIQADIKAVSALGAYAMTAIAALTAQNTTGVYGVVPVDPAFVALQMKLVLEDIGADAVKIGMLANAPVIEAVAAEYEERAVNVPLVLDPVMIAKSGHHLLDPDAVLTLRRRLLPLAEVVTPNLPEAEALTDLPIRDLDDMRRAAELMLSFGPKSVLLKGGHLEDDTLYDLLLTEEGETVFEGRRVHTPHTHGTGCTLSSAIAAGLAQGLSTRDAVARARRYVETAILTAPGLGHGHGPLNHLHTVREFS